MPMLSRTVRKVLIPKTLKAIVLKSDAVPVHVLAQSGTKRIKFLFFLGQRRVNLNKCTPHCQSLFFLNSAQSI